MHLFKFYWIKSAIWGRRCHGGARGLFLCNRISAKSKLIKKGRYKGSRGNRIQSTSSSQSEQRVTLFNLHPHFWLLREQEKVILWNNSRFPAKLWEDDILVLFILYIVMCEYLIDFMRLITMIWEYSPRN